jgi:queuine tRNA-ribosyltransferase
VSVHNLAWTISLMNEMREAIQKGTFSDLKRRILDVWA